MRILKFRNCIFAAVFFLGIQQASLAQQGRVEIKQSDLIPELLALKSEMVRSVKLGERYVIQLYYGENKTASDILKEFRTRYNEWPAVMIYETPNYKVWIGNFRNRLEADQALLKLKKDYPAAFIPKPQRGLP